MSYTITIDDNDGTRLVFDNVSSDIANKVIMISSGAKIIEYADSRQHTNENKNEQKITSNTDEKWYNPNQREIVNFITSLPEYKHTTKEVLENFNPGRDITLSRKEDDINRNVWYSVLQKLRTSRKNIKKAESGRWEEERIGQEKQYRFVKY